MPICRSIEFTIEQLAGDLLPGATVDDRVATGFHRNTMLNEEGGIDPLEFRFYAMVDRVEHDRHGLAGADGGLAQCHTHKYDPMPQQRLLPPDGVFEQRRRAGNRRAQA